MVDLIRLSTPVGLVINPTEEEMDGLGEDAAEAATLRALDSNLRRYYAGLNLEGKRKAVEFLAILAGNVDFRA